MAPNVTFTDYAGPSEHNRKVFSYSQAVRIGSVVKCSGQGGWDAQGTLAKDDIKQQVQYAFDNLERCIKEAGGKGWSDVYAVRSWHTNLDETFPVIVEQFKRSMPDHAPIWTCVGVASLALPGMEIEIDCGAYVESGGNGAVRRLLIKLWRMHEMDHPCGWHARTQAFGGRLQQFLHV